MDIYIMNTPTDPEHVIKQIVPNDWETTCKRQGSVRGEANEDGMTFEVDGNVLDENYCYIPDFRRFYWITEREVYRTGITALTLVSDPLMSFYSGYEEGGEHVTGIEDLPIYVTRCSPRGDENTLLQIGFDSYLRDDGVPVIEKVRTELMLDDQNLFSFDSMDNYYLVTVT